MNFPTINCHPHNVLFIKDKSFTSIKGELKIFFEEKFFSIQNFRKPLFLAVFDKKFENSSEPAELNRRREACNSAK